MQSGIVSLVPTHSEIRILNVGGKIKIFAKTTFELPYLSQSFFGPANSARWSTENELFIDADPKLFDAYIAPYLRSRILPVELPKNDAGQVIATAESLLLLELSEHVKEMVAKTMAQGERALGNKNIPFIQGKIDRVEDALTFFLQDATSFMILARVMADKSLPVFQLYALLGFGVHAEADFQAQRPRWCVRFDGMFLSSNGVEFVHPVYARAPTVGDTDGFVPPVIGEFISNGSTVMAKKCAESNLFRTYNVTPTLFQRVRPSTQAASAPQVSAPANLV
jgi:hypothetical protein